ncbi:SusC/RagA family TonB-linked outer membrane protein [Bacteroidia bacterium]|nr:SusC/RagA family TonB-linked outer membrane protein [Bacteroidia bacterium]
MKNLLKSSLKFILLFTVSLLSCGAFVQGQNLKIKGRVIDKKTQETLIGATIYVVNEKTGTVTDIDGNFIIEPQSFPAILSVQYLGYKTLEVNVPVATGALTISLTEDAGVLDEMVVIGYGTQRRKELTGSVATISQSVLEHSGTSFDAALGGAVAGLNVTQASGQPGASSSIRIRGGNSVYASNEPLYVIDGIIYNHSTGSMKTSIGASSGLSQGTIESTINPLSSINPSDIESIEVLKDVSATAIFGSRGANGVIIVSTKKGLRGKDVINYRFTTGWSTPAKRLNLMNAQEWSKLQIDHYGNKGNLTGDYLAQIGKGYDWQKEVLQTGFSQNHELSVIGGNEKTKYLISGNYADQDGIVLNTGFNRYNFRINIDRDLYENLTVGGTATYGKSAQSSLATTTQPEGANSTPFQDGITNQLTYALFMPPTVPIYNSDGSFNNKNPWESSHFSLNGVQVNPVSDLKNSVAESVNQSLMSNFYARYTILNGLTAKVTLSTDQNNITQNYFAPSTSGLGLMEGGVGSIGKIDQEVWQTDAILEFSKKFNYAHFLNIMGGYTYQKTQYIYQSTTTSQYADETRKHHDLAAGEKDYTPVNGIIDSDLKSIIARANYSLLERYNLTATLRVDYSKKLAVGKRWNPFPSIGFSWNMDEEPFWEKQSIVNSLKLRLTAGKVGNQDIDDYLFLTTYKTQRYGGHVVSQMNNFGNDDLKWETTNQYNAGIDAGLFDKRLNLIADVYYKNTSDLLLDLPTPLGSAVTHQMVNAGNVINKGAELGVNAVLIQNQNFSWNMAANIARNINTITNMSTSDGTTDPEHKELIYREGSSLGSFYGFVFDGIVQADEDLSQLPTVNHATPKPGDAKFVDKKKDGNIDINDQVIIGSIQPDFIYGFNSSLAYRDFDLFVSFQGSQGNEVYNSLRMHLESPNSSYNVSTALLDAWTPTNPSNQVAKIGESQWKYTDSRYLEDASYFRLKNITLGYTIKVEVAPVTARIFVTAQNLFTLTGYKGYDPEVVSGVDMGAYPTARTFSMGASITF